jgi:hypothetical protein
VIYVLPTDPVYPPVSFSALRQRAKRLGYRIHGDRYAGTYTLIDKQLSLPISGLEHVALPIIANAIEAVRTGRV